MSDSPATKSGIDDKAFLAIASRTDAMVADIALDALRDAGLSVVSANDAQETAILISGYKAAVSMLEDKCSKLLQRLSQ